MNEVLVVVKAHDHLVLFLLNECDELPDVRMSCHELLVDNAVVVLDVVVCTRSGRVVMIPQARLEYAVQPSGLEVVDDWRYVNVGWQACFDEFPAVSDSG